MVVFAGEVWSKNAWVSGWIGVDQTGRRSDAPTADPPTETLFPPTSANKNDQTTKVPTGPAGPFRRWRWRNAELLTEKDRELGHDPGGFCAQHNRWLTYPEQQRGACSWCVPVDLEREPEYWDSHWRRYTERQ